jgi:hypothetical protein
VNFSNSSTRGNAGSSLKASTITSNITSTIDESEDNENDLFMCNYDGCERRMPGNGFSQHSNLVDHIKHVHSDASIIPNANASEPSSAPASIATSQSHDLQEERNCSTTGNTLPIFMPMGVP